MRSERELLFSYIYIIALYIYIYVYNKYIYIYMINYTYMPGQSNIRGQYIFVS